MKITIKQLYGMWWSKGIQHMIEKKIYHTIVQGIVFYNLEVWEVEDKLRQTF